VADAIRSFAPRARLVAGAGLGGLTALALRRRHARLLPGLALVSTLPGAAPGREWRRSGPERYASRAEALAALAGRRPESSRRALRREVLYELRQDPDGSWAWRHHLGNLPAAADPVVTSGADPLWGERAQLQVPLALIRSDWAGPLAAADLAIARQRAPQIRQITIPGAGLDIAATQPAALAAALGHLLTTDQVRQ
jgi:pimeloyl-ACP methyl ester carboxylesterase